MKQFETVVTVRPTKGRPDFPVDMLRYDRLAPHREEDSYNIARERQDRTPGDGMVVELVRYAPKGWTPTQGRWESFGWVVASVDTTGRIL